VRTIPDTSENGRLTIATLAKKSGDTQDLFDGVGPQIRIIVSSKVVNDSSRELWPEVKVRFHTRSTSDLSSIQANKIYYANVSHCTTSA
jgi:hypothetical protein